MFDLVDRSIAEELGVPVQEFIDKIESTTEKRAALIIEALFSGDPKAIEKAKRIFKMI